MILSNEKKSKKQLTPESVFLALEDTFNKHNGVDRWSELMIKI